MNLIDYQRRAAGGNLGRRAYDLLKKRQQIQDSLFWQRHANPVNAAAQAFADELAAVIRRTHQCGTPFVSCGSSITISLPSPCPPGKANGFHYQPEIVVNLRPSSVCRKANVMQLPWMQFRLDNSGMVHRRMTLRKNETPERVWARCRHHFAHLEIESLALAA